MHDLLPILPIVTPVIGALLIVVIDAIHQLPGKRAGALIKNLLFKKKVDVPPSGGWNLERSVGASLFFLLSFIFSITIIISYTPTKPHIALLSSSLTIDKFALAGFLLISAGGFLASLMAGGYLYELQADRGGFHPLLLLSGTGAMILVSAGDFITFFIGLETMSLGAYALTGFRIASPRSVEGGLKYFLLGSFASAMMLYGIALLYGQSGSVQISAIGNVLRGSAAHNPLVICATMLVLVGLSFKIAAVPFHMWSPEAYQGAPTPATGFMATVIKAAGFIAMVRVLNATFKDPLLAGPPFGWASILSVVCVLTMLWGNLAALKQKNIKRMLAYSSIAHAGYILIAIVSAWVYPTHTAKAQWAFSPIVKASIIYYLAAYIAAKAGAFAIISIACHGGAEATDIEDYRGFGRKHPLLALALTICLLSLLGMPPLGGFFGKLYVFTIAVESGLYLLAVVGMIASVISAYYYIGVIVTMYMKEQQEGVQYATTINSYQIKAAIILSVLLVILLGIYPSPILTLLMG